MQVRTCLLSAFTVSMAMFFGIAGLAADLAKEGTYKGTYSGHGTLKTNSVGDRTVAVFDETGLSLTDGFADHMTWHCWGMTEFTKGMGEDQGYCLGTDLAGDKILMKLAGEKHAPDQKRWNDPFTCIEGTGKYVGVSCSETDLILGNEFPEVPDGAYVQHAAVQGTYKLK